jgi:hypothetical protein
MSPNAEAFVYICVVCNEQAEAAMTAECNWCNCRYHLNQRNDIQAKDCGQVWIDEQYLALQFACNGCLAGTDRAQPPAPAPSRRSAVRRTAPTRPRRYKRHA